MKPGFTKSRSTKYGSRKSGSKPSGSKKSARGKSDGGGDLVAFGVAAVGSYVTGSMLPLGGWLLGKLLARVVPRTYNWIRLLLGTQVIICNDEALAAAINAVTLSRPR